MRVDADKPDSSDGYYLRIAGVSLVVAMALAQIGMYWWDGPARPWPLLYSESDSLALGGWIVAGFALLLARYESPFRSLAGVGGVIAFAIWQSVKSMEKQGVADWSSQPVTAEHMRLIAAIVGAFAVFHVGPAVGAWLAGYGMRRRAESQREMLRMNVDHFD
jgi:hypothetical protein